MFSAEKIHDIVQEQIKKHGTRNPFEFADVLKVSIEYNYKLTDCKGLYLKVLGNKFVYLNGNLDEYTQKVVLAHELGHELLHSEIAQLGIQEFSLYDMQNRVEFEANLFAADFLLPDNEVIALVKEQYDIPQIAAILYTNSDLLQIKLYSMKQRELKW